MSLTKDEPGKSPNGSLKKLYEYYDVTTTKYKGKL